jgi:hypothetical protein
MIGWSSLLHADDSLYNVDVMVRIDGNAEILGSDKSHWQ